MNSGTTGNTAREYPRETASSDFARRRDLRAERTGLVVRPAVAAPVTIAAAPHASGPSGVKRTLVNMAAITVATGLIATMALPGTGITQDSPATADSALAAGNVEAIAQLMSTESQSVLIDESVVGVQSALRDEFSATTVEELAAARAAEERAAAIAAAAAAPPVPAGPQVSDYLANPAYPSFSLDQIVQVALQYQGVPYVFGGASPAGFDCSGFIQYVYAQFGIALPHGVRGQDAAGTRISREAALPGDLVIMPGHNGIYLGNGMFIDSPRAGGVVSVRPIWTDNYWIVRIGI